jgi:hypothetical protein
MGPIAVQCQCGREITMGASMQPMQDELERLHARLGEVLKVRRAELFAGSAYRTEVHELAEAFTALAKVSCSHGLP